MHPYIGDQIRPFSEGEATPCDGCRFAQRCVDNKLACDALSLYAKNVSPLRWRRAPRAPTRARYEIMEQQLRKRLAA
jgi:hypothetical protein